MSVSEYKRTHQPKPLTESDKGKPKQGIYVPKNTEKVVGGEIITRSGWEMSFARWCDDNPDVVEWGCETVAIEYRNPGTLNFESCKRRRLNPLDPKNWKVNNYYPDFYLKMRISDDEGNESFKRMLIEIKPKYQTLRPEIPGSDAKLKDQKKFNIETRTYLQNLKKWEAAKKWCEANGFEFKVFTEDSLHAIGVL